MTPDERRRIEQSRIGRENDATLGVNAAAGTRRRAHRRVRLPGREVAQSGDRDDISAADSDASWGDHPDDEDRWLRDQKPPHW